MAPTHPKRKGPIAKQWVGEVVVDKHGMFLVRAPLPTSPSRASRGPLPLPPLKRAERAFEARCVNTMVSDGSRKRPALTALTPQ